MTESYHDALPAEYEYRRPPTVVEDEEEEFEIKDNYDDSLVAYRADGGVVNYQARPENLSEEQQLRKMIRSIISESDPTLNKRMSILEIMDDYVYEEDDDDPDSVIVDPGGGVEDDVDEQDSIAGFMQPLGYGSAAERKKRRDSTIRAVAGAFGGADY